jgi:hypothetical protein
MGLLLPSYKKAIIDELLDNVSSNTSYYYAFAANPTPHNGIIPTISNDDQLALFTNDWEMIFGKRLYPSNFAPLIKNNQWTINSIYDRYDNTDKNLLANNNYYVISPPEYTGGSYNIYKCLDNANGAPSTIRPTTIQSSTFQTSDGYKWRYLTSITYKQYVTFSTVDYCPVYANAVTTLYSNTYAGVEVVMISNSGSGYSAYHNGIVRSANSTVIQIENSASDQNDLYKGSAIYVYNTITTTSQIFQISSYVSNSVGNWVYLSTEANTTSILPNATQYKISPRVVFDTDGYRQPVAYSVVDSTSNTISDIVVLDVGEDISRASISLDTNSGSGANLYAITPPPGGHGYDILSELNVQGISIQFTFSNNENSTIPTEAKYNKVGIVKNPRILLANTDRGGQYTANTYNQLLEATVSSPIVFTVGDTVTGESSNAVGRVAFSNTTVLYLTGDKYFIDGETVTSSDGTQSVDITITNLGDVYAKNLRPIYIENLNNVTRSNTTAESFKLIIQV